ncbi:hypothetical protein BDV59DRAFT_203068 [Aspergillus ambiguus]|uniref:uncharacterized protein n=1 Tax=Aspergillus ambiguus TaxID=176160 RepID=UPI003CCD7560
MKLLLLQIPFLAILGSAVATNKGDTVCQWIGSLPQCGTPDCPAGWKMKALTPCRDADNCCDSGYQVKCCQ